MDGDDFVCLRVVSSKIHDDTKGDYYACVEENWTHAKIANSINVIEHEERLKDYIDKCFGRLEAIVKKNNDCINNARLGIGDFVELKDEEE